MKSSALAFIALTALVSCGTPQQQCDSRVSSEYKQVQRLLAEVNQNISRGYAWESGVASSGGSFSFCAGGYRGGYRGVGLGLGSCYGGSDVVRKRVAIDPAAELRKRDALQKRLASLDRGHAACAVRYGQGD